MTDKVNALIAEALKLPVDRVVDELEYGAVREWDSLGHVNLMLKLEAVYGVEIDEDRMIALTSVRAIRAFVGGEA